MEVYAEKLRKLGGYMAERVTDLYDIRNRATARLRGLPEPGVPDLETPSILVAHDLAPAETATLDKNFVLGIVTEAGATAITITHDMGSARVIGDRVALLDGGRVRWQGPVAAMQDAPDAYLQDFIAGRARADGSQPGD